jgi:hypothetical protein
MLAKFALEDTAVVINAGTVCRLKQLENILDMFTTATVLNNGTD